MFEPSTSGYYNENGVFDIERYKQDRYGKKSSVKENSKRPNSLKAKHSDSFHSQQETSSL